MFCGRRFGHWSSPQDRDAHRDARRSARDDWRAFKRNARWGGRQGSGNVAFDEYRMETLRKLDDEQRDFHDYLDRLRSAKDRAEFDQFMNERRNNPPKAEPPATPPAQY